MTDKHEVWRATLTLSVLGILEAMGSGQTAAAITAFPAPRPETP